MSVINQMLKDLDERQNEQQHSHNSSVPIRKQGTPWKLITIIVIAVIALNALGIYVWQLYNENKSLKSFNDHSPEQNQLSHPVVKKLDNTLNTDSAVPKNSTLIETVNNEEDSSPVENVQTANVLTNTSLDNSTIEKQIKTQQKQPEQQNKLAASNVLNSEANRVLTDKNQTELKSNTTESHHIQVDVIKVKEENKALLINDKPQLSISRKQLTAAELTQQKIDQAEQALAENKLTRAEKLFEDILLMSPEHKIARKKLAALWFGRQAYQPAINVLSQGIQLYPEDSEFRLMKARIYLNQGQTTAAVNTLKDLPSVENIEYQALLASHAQQISQFDLAITAYQLLTTLEPNAGRWWLGLAVAYDSDSDFEQAKRAYGQAINKNDLSDNARQFAVQRVQELGE